ncbi:MAG TPA: NACHT domain-containing protein [Anaerolineae bacterium]|nr:NACHT domain-containing protein [Anaerolineae bacterium]
MTKFKQLSWSVFEHYMGTVLGEKAVADFRENYPNAFLLDIEGEGVVAQAQRSWEEGYEDRGLVNAVRQVDLADLPAMRGALIAFYERPSRPFVPELLTAFEAAVGVHYEGQRERLRRGAADFLERLREVLLAVPAVREQLTALAVLRGEQQRERQIALLTIIGEQLEGKRDWPRVDSLLPAGEAGERAFYELVDLLQYHGQRRQGKRVDFPVGAGSRQGLAGSHMAYQRYGDIGFIVRYYLSPLGRRERQEVENLVEGMLTKGEGITIKQLCLITPHELSMSAVGQQMSDYDWFRGLQAKFKPQMELIHWGHWQLLRLFKETPALGLYYYPELIAGGVERRQTIQDTKRRYIDNLLVKDKIQFVGMSIYKEEAARGIPMDQIYIPLATVPTATGHDEGGVTRTNPLTFLRRGGRHVILGDPGSGKSTLLRFLSLVGQSEKLQVKYGGERDEERLPILVVLRRYGQALSKDRALSLLDYIQASWQADFNLERVDLDFLEYFLETGQAILLFDGLDELGQADLKEQVCQSIQSLTITYPGNTVIVSSRIVGYTYPLRLDETMFAHHRVAKLDLAGMRQFVEDWYGARLDVARERREHVADLMRLLEEERHGAIRNLAENPLLLTIIALVHRIDAVLPDERVVLYQKCVETLLNTWHAWRSRQEMPKRWRNKRERLNQRRMEAIAYWMHCQISGDDEQKMVVGYDELHTFLSQHIAEETGHRFEDDDPEDVAHQFLDFVREKAGLLIEVGAGQYSFVHLSFQEYLAAAYLHTYGELGGVEAVWGMINERWYEPVWLEVMRLLVAQYKSGSGQAVLVKKLLAAEGAEGAVFQQGMLLGGLLLDGIDAADELAEEIMRLLIEVYQRVEALDQVQQIVNQFDLCLRRDGRYQAIFEAIEGEVAREDDGQEKYLFMLLRLSLPTVQGEMAAPVEMVLQYLQAGFSKEGFIERQEKFGHALDAVSFEFSVGNVWRVIQGVAEGDGGGEAQRLYNGLLGRLGGMVSLYSPLSHFLSYQLFGLIEGLFIQDDEQKLKIAVWLTLALDRALDRALNRDWDWALALALDRVHDRALDLALARARVLDLDLALDRARALERDLAQALDLARVRDWALDLARDWAQALALALDLERTLELGLGSLQNKRTISVDDLRSHLSEQTHVVSHWIDIILADEDLLQATLDVLSAGWDLAPRAQWQEVLRVSFLPYVPERLVMFKPEVWQRTLTAWETGVVGEREIYEAGWQLLLDASLYVLGFYEVVGEGPYFEALAAVTRGEEAAVVQIAHCIRDVAYGREERVADLRRMLASDDPAFREVFVRCYWLEG